MINPRPRSAIMTDHDQIPSKIIDHEPIVTDQQSLTVMINDHGLKINSESIKVGSRSTIMVRSRSTILVPDRIVDPRQPAPSPTPNARGHAMHDDHVTGHHGTVTGMTKDQRTGRRGNPALTVRMSLARKQLFTDMAHAQSTTASDLVDQFVAWYLGEAGATCPQRPEVTRDDLRPTA